MRARLLALAVVVAIVAAWPSVGAAKLRIVGHVRTDQPMKARFVDDAIGRAYPNDPNRCLAVGFAEWPREEYAYRYEVTVDPPPGFPGAFRQTLFETDDALLEAGRDLYRNPPPARSYVTTIGTFSWAENLARAVINSYSVGTGCGDATAGLARWSIVKAIAKLSIPVVRIVPDPKPVKPPFPNAPKGAVAMVVEVNGAQLYRNRGGRRQRIRYRDYVKPGDVIWLEGKGSAAIEFITGGRTGFVGDRAILIMNDNQVKDITSEGPLAPPLRQAERIWKKVSTRKDPLEVEVAGGVMGIKG